MENSLQKFYENVAKDKVNECFFRFGDEECQVCYCGHYIIIENVRTQEAEEFYFAEKGENLIEAFLNAKVLKNKTLTLRETLENLSPDELILT